ncbi:cannabidiolic acid synthase-like 1 [Cannabis sativa]|uniref:FAD-binding PCMH-type domain-containing protein n=1 Tax=Cannabis sativa TaxID=3483 RepID=A0A803QE24_CANSA|nr:cannabidiolic acid synthase-like 1 [Cannabis sativa]
MKYYLAFFSLLSFCIIVTNASQPHEDFLQCLSHNISNTTTLAELTYTRNDSSFISVMSSNIQNLRFSFPSTPKPLVIVTPSNASHVQASVYCSKIHGLEIRTRSGGHDFEGLSYVSEVPFVIIDLRNLSSINVNVDEKTAWVEAGATIGEVYYRIAEKSRNLGFPAGFCPTVGVGGHFSGGGYGPLVRKYGLAADNIIDAYIVNVDGKILDRESMGEDLFWAIRGGGAASFGIVLAWKIRLVPVPSTVTTFIVNRDLGQNETMKLVNKWQYIADKLDDDLVILIRFSTVNSTQNNKVILQAQFLSLFLGGVDNLLSLMEKSFPEFGLKREDCNEMSWIESVSYFAGFPIGAEMENLLNRTQQWLFSFKGKLDYVKKTIPENVLKTMLEKLYEEDVGVGFFQLFPYGGKMNEISESEIPFSHRAGNLYKILYYAQWVQKPGDDDDDDGSINWPRSVYKYMTPYVSKSPRSAYVNYRDLDLGKNNDKGPTSYTQASIWGRKYFGKDNFKRLVHVKTKVDPQNFFRNEQSIPPLPLPLPSP